MSNQHLESEAFDSLEKGLLEIQKGDYNKAIHHFETSFGRYDTLHSIFPDNNSYQNAKGIVLSNLGACLLNLGEFHEVRKKYQNALNIYEELLAEDKGNIEYKYCLAMTLANLGACYPASLNYEEVVHIYEKAINIYYDLLSYDQENKDYKNSIGIALNNLGGCHQDAGCYEEGLSRYKEALTIYEELQEDSENGQYQNDIAEISRNIGICLKSMEKYPEATEAFGSALKIHKDLQQSYPCEIPNDKNIAEIFNNLGICAWFLGRYGEAEDKFRNALKIYETIVAGNSENEVHRNMEGTVHINLGACLSDRGRYNEALREFEQAESIYTTLVKRDNEDEIYRNYMGTTLSNAGTCLKYLGYYDEAMEKFTKALLLFETLLDTKPENKEYRKDVAMILNNMGTGLWVTGNYREAELKYRRSLGLYEDIPENVVSRNAVAMSLNNLGTCLRSMGYYEDARQECENALRIRQSLFEEDRKSEAFGNHLATTLNNLGNCLRAMCRYDDAQEKYNEALAIYKDLLSRDKKNVEYENAVAMTLHNLGACLTGMECHKDAREKFEEALERRYSILADHPENGNYYNNVALTLNNLGSCFRLMGKYEESRKKFERALEIYDNLPVNRDNEIYKANKGMILNNIGLCLGSMGLHKEASMRFREALRLAETIKNRDSIRDLLWRIHYSLAKSSLFAEKTDLAAAYSHLLQSIEEIRVIRTFVSSTEETRQKYQENKEGVYRLMIQICIIKGEQLEGTGKNKKAREKFGEAFEWLEESRSRTLLDLLASRDIKKYIRDTKDEELLENYEELRRQIAALQGALSGAPETGSYDSISDIKGTHPEEHDIHSRDVSTQRLIRLQKEIEKIILRMKDKYPEFFSLREGIPLKTSEISEKLQEQLGDSVSEVLIVEYFQTEKQLIIFLLDPATGSISICKPSITSDRTAVKNMVEQFRKAIEFQMPHIRKFWENIWEFNLSSSGADLPDYNYYLEILRNEIKDPGKAVRETCNKLYYLLHEPIKEKIRYNGKKRLIIVPDGELHHIPLYALFDGEKYLLEDPDLLMTVFQSASALPLVFDKRNKKTSSAGLIVAPLDHPEGEREAKEISSYFISRVGNTPYLGENGKRSVIETLGEEAGIIHIITHGNYNKEFPMQSSLAFPDSDLTAYDVYNLDLRRCNLVTASACLSASGDVSKGNEMAGLIRGFLYAGAPAYVGSLWSVETSSSSDIMINFQKLTASGVPIDKALKDSILTYFGNENGAFGSMCREPFFWAPFCNYGSFLAVK